MTSPSEWPVEGLLVHVAGQGPKGFRVVDVWASEDAFRRFGEKLIPVLREVGTNPKTQILSSQHRRDFDLGFGIWGLPQLQRIVLRGVQRLSPAECRSDVTADDVQAVADDAAGQTVACERHVAERLPAVARRVVGLERA